MTRPTTKQYKARQYIGEIIRIEITESGARGDTMEDSRSSFLLREITSMFGGVWSPQRHNQRHEGLSASPYSPVSNVTKA
jgi:hypothetical protein